MDAKDVPPCVLAASLIAYSGDGHPASDDLAAGCLDLDWSLDDRGEFDGATGTGVGMLVLLQGAVDPWLMDGPGGDLSIIRQTVPVVDLRVEFLALEPFSTFWILSVDFKVNDSVGGDLLLLPVSDSRPDV